MFQARSSLFNTYIYIILLSISSPAFATGRGESPQLTAYQMAIEELAANLNQRQGDKFLAMLEQDVLLSRVFESSEINAKAKANFSTSFRNVFQQLPERLISQMPANGYAKVLRTSKIQGGAKVLMRVDYGDNGYGYFDFLVNKDQQDNFKIIDWFNYSSGQYYSESLRQLVMLSMPSTNTWGRLFDIFSGQIQNQKKVSAFMTAMRNKEYDQAYAHYQDFGPTLKKNRILMVLVVQTANLSGDNQFYHVALTDLDKYFGNEPELTFLLLDFYFLEERYSDAVRSLDKLQEEFGIADAALIVMKANALIAAGKFKQGLKVVQSAVKLEPEFENAYWVWFSGSVLTNDYPTAVKVGRVLEQSFGYELTAEAMSEDDMYQGFLASAAFRDWKK